MKEFKERVLLPLLVPLGALAVIVVVVLNISRILLALEERSGPHAVVVVGVILSAAVLFGCASFASQGERTKGSMSLLSVAGIMVIIAGFVGYEAIQEDQTKEREAAAAQASANKPDITVEAFDIGFKEKDFKIGPGKVTIQEINTGATAHTFVLDGVVGKKLSVPGNGAKDQASFELKPGTYTYYCDIPGHRGAGMEGKIEVDPSFPPPGSGGAGGAAAGTPVKIDAADLSYTPKEVKVPAGPVAVTLDNVGKIQHTLVIEGDPTFKKLVADPGATPSGTFDAKAGQTYTFYCDIPGHRAAGMETKVTVG